MEKKDLYNIVLENNNIFYSIDKIRLKTYIAYSVFNELDFYFRAYFANNIKKYWISDRIMHFKYNYNFEIEEGKSFYLAFHHNNEKKDEHSGKYNLTIEFNPNKLKDNRLIRHILLCSNEWLLKSYDLACDIPVNILALITDISGRSLERIDNRGFDNKTIYIGKGDGRIKIYNKKIESNLKILGELTRVEISREVEDFEIRKVKILNYDGYFPNIYTTNYNFSFDDYKDKTILALLYAVQNGFPLRDLSRAYKKKVKEMLEEGTKIKFSSKTATDILRRTIFFYFIPNQDIIWW